MPRPGTPLIDPRWASHLSPVAELQMVDTCTISGPGVGPGVFDPTTGRTTPPARAVIYTGRCRFQALDTEGHQIDFGDQTLNLHQYRLCVPRDVDGLTVDMLAHCDNSRDDPALTGRTFRVIDIATATLTWQRNLICQDVEEN